MAFSNRAEAATASRAVDGYQKMSVGLPMTLIAAAGVFDSPILQPEE